MREKPHERYLQQARRVLREARKGNLPDALDALYQLSCDLGYGDPMVSFLASSKALLSDRFRDALSLVNYAKLSGYNRQELFRHNYITMEWVANSPVRGILNLVNPAISIAAIELLRNKEIVTYARLLGPSRYPLVLTVARAIALGATYLSTSVENPCMGIRLNEDQLILMSLLGENYPMAMALLGGTSVEIPGPKSRLRSGTRSELISAAITRAIDDCLEAYRSPEGTPGELLDNLDTLLSIMSKRARLLDKDIAKVRHEKPEGKRVG